MPASDELWQEIAWDGMFFRLPDSWQPTVINKSYLFFEREGQPVFAVKWERVRGRFSADHILKRMRHSLKSVKAVLEPWDAQKMMPEMTPPNYSVTGFQYKQDVTTCLGMLLFCRHCRRATLLQHFDRDPGDRQILSLILQNFADHQDGPERVWAIYDIRARLPAEAELRSHEFLAGRFSLSFTLPRMNIELYRFKPAAAILHNQSLQEFGASLAGEAGCIDNQKNSSAVWEYTASGLARIGALLGRKPAWIRLHLEYLEKQNAILGVKGEGKHAAEPGLVRHVADNFTVRETA